MGKWDVRIPSELMGSGSLPQIIESHGDGTESWIASVGSISVAMQIVREHNMHEKLMGLARGYIKVIEYAMKFSIGDEHDDLIERRCHIDGVLAQAEGRDS